MSEGKDELIELTGLWENTSAAGTRYLSGNMGGARVLIFFNTDKRSERSPDARLMVSKRKRREQDAGGAQNQSGYSDPAQPQQVDDDDSSIPF